MTTKTVNRFWGLTEPRPFPRVSNEVPVTAGQTEASLRIYGPIDDWGDIWGVSAKEVATALDLLPESVQTIHLHINSPGGLIFEGIAIKNLLANHSAKVVAHVDGIAASIASLIAVGADELVMGQDSTLMIHDGSTAVWGNAGDLRAAAEVLDTLSDTIAGVYARKAGGASEEWREVMRGEKWYSAEAAVEAGLADRVAGAEEVPEDPAAAAEFDLSGLRAAAPAEPVETPRADLAAVGREVQKAIDAYTAAGGREREVAAPPEPTEEPATVSHLAARTRLRLAASRVL